MADIFHGHGEVGDMTCGLLYEEISKLVVVHSALRRFHGNNDGISENELSLKLCLSRIGLKTWRQLENIYQYV